MSRAEVFSWFMVALSVVAFVGSVVAAAVTSDMGWAQPCVIWLVAALLNVNSAMAAAETRRILESSRTRMRR